MPLRTRADLLLLLLASACLLFGGGVGCDPVLEGVDFRAGSVLSDPGDRTSPRDWFMAFGGKKAPGNGRAQLPYPVKAPFGVSARMGVFVAGALAASAGADGCIGFRHTASSDEYRLCVTYEVPANVRVFSNLDGTTADCAGASRVELDLDDDGVNVTASYRCSGSGSFSPLTSVASLWGATEKWNAFVSAAGLVKGGQVAFDDFRLDTAGPFSGDDEAEIAWETFSAFALGVEAFILIENEEFDLATLDAADAAAKLQFARENLNPGFAESSDADKLLDKAEGSHTKLLEGLLLGIATKYPKGFVKAADIDADALEALGPGF